jgi:hypothetical protein
MATLTVQSFSCIESATLNLSRMTILIGPQASGKSVLSKLVYFSYNILSLRFGLGEELDSLEEFTAGLTERFKKWFPPAAWGNKRFQILFEAGPFSVQMTRGASKGKPNERIKVTFSEYFKSAYEALVEGVRAARSKSSSAKEGSSIFPFERIWEVQTAAQKKFEADLGPDFVSFQMFVPAGRSFYTNVGKAVTAFEHAGFLDPLTVQFGRLFASVREQQQGDHLVFGKRVNKRVQELRQSTLPKLIGGDIKITRNEEYLQAPDGRKVPFSALSSGQQELIPLWMTFGTFITDPQDKEMTYIEEPEAHLFPTAQSLLIEFLASFVSPRASNQRMLITTHSPYVLSKVNNLLKAGQIAQSAGRTAQQRLSSIIARDFWLPPSSVNAFAIKGGVLTSIVDEEGLIDGDYLDNVSGDIAREFSLLLELELDVERP